MRVDGGAQKTVVPVRSCPVLSGPVRASGLITVGNFTNFGHFLSVRTFCVRIFFSESKIMYFQIAPKKIRTLFLGAICKYIIFDSERREKISDNNHNKGIIELFSKIDEKLILEPPCLEVTKSENDQNRRSFCSRYFQNVHVFWNVCLEPSRTIC